MCTHTINVFGNGYFNITDLAGQPIGGAHASRWIESKLLLRGIGLPTRASYPLHRITKYSYRTMEVCII